MSVRESTEADEQIREVLEATKKQGFVVIAGAGSGKTTSLVKALRHIGRTEGPTLLGQRRQVACITYTNVAVEEIKERLAANPLFHISTIHSFLWSVVQPFQYMIREWVRADIHRLIAERDETRGAKYVEALECLNDPALRFNYQSGRNYQKGFLGHDDVLRMVPELIKREKRLATIIAQRFPYVMVDESQDTDPKVVEALQAVEEQEREEFCLGFFGDPMQRIFPTGAGLIEADTSWTTIRKKENWRCPERVLDVINKIRRMSPHDGDLTQVRGEREGEEEPNTGDADLFVLSSEDDSDIWLDRVRDHLSVRQNDLLWSQGVEGKNLKILVLEHRLAARRLGFMDVDSAFHQSGRRYARQLREEYIAGTHWSLRPLLDRIIPLVEAIEQKDGITALGMLRRLSPRLGSFRDGQATAELLPRLKADGDHLARILARDSTDSVADVLRHALHSELIRLDPRLKAQLLKHEGFSFVERLPVEQGEAAEDTGEQLEETRQEEQKILQKAMTAYLACPAAQIRIYHDYVSGRLPYQTQHGVKGAEFERVLVLLEDDRSNWNQYSYEKLLGLKDLSTSDISNIRAEKDHTPERTRRLFYVSCSRATRSLAVVLFTNDPDRALQELREDTDCPFPADRVHGIEDLEGYPGHA
ncbi:UvrD-helicase domain-containing protein [Nocardiopsis deserti]|uniref:UvrD-helicase domain-containing protein n=1 Tax=Nocardiopsis deserti TaxID=2605988 RepID=UPI0016808841|nr:UvrD-helicase domain-containing protein [Nocardiopsis deserti]